MATSRVINDNVHWAGSLTPTQVDGLGAVAARQAAAVAQAAFPRRQ